LLDLLTKRVETLYRSDARGRIVCSNEWDTRPAPRFHVVLTAFGPIARFRGDIPDALAHRLESICRREPPRKPGPGLPSHRGDLIEALEAHASVEQVWCGPAYRMPEDTGLEVASTVPVNQDNAQLLEHGFAGWLADVSHRQPFMAVVEDGRAAAVCASVRISPAVHCAGVETHADYRRRGYALRAVAGWARAVRALGATPFYSTAWGNIASQRVASRLGFEMVGVDFHVT
jgi:GNAT superfamily N-acetyltransferase